MWRRFFVSAVACGLGGLITMHASPAEAQRVRVGYGGVHVRAPFVRVDVGPYGGVSVRAPFAAIDVPPDDYYYYGPEYPPPLRVERRIVRQAYPDAIELAAMSDAELERAIFGISQDLHNDLRRFNTGSTWQRYLRLPDALLDRSTPAGNRIEATINLLERFYKISDDPQYSMIARVPSFVAMQAALNEVVARHEEGRGPRDPASSEPTPATPSQPIPPQSTPAEPDGEESSDEDLPLPAPNQPTREGRNEPFLRPRN